jgi:hypothetical protein
MPVEAANREETGLAAFGSVKLKTPDTLNLTTFDSATVVRPV